LVFSHADDAIRYRIVTGVQTCALPICRTRPRCVLPNHLLVIVPVFHPAVPWALATKPVPAPASYLEIRRTPPCSTKCSWPIGARSPFAHYAQGTSWAHVP